MIITICFALNLNLVFGQSTKCTINGYVTEANSSEHLVSANVYTSNLDHGTTTNKFGFFSLTLPCISDTSSVVLEASYVGYNHAEKTVPLQTDTLITFALKPVLKMQEIEVVGQAKESITNSTRMSVTSVSGSRINNTPVLLGEADVLKTLQLLPGVQGGLEGTSGLNVRGGSPDQNLILLDGVPVYNAYHLFGVFSVFNSDAVKHVEITKGGFPARYGGRLSSVVEVNMKEGNMKNYEGKAGIGLIASRLTFEGPIVKDKASFIVSARRTYLDLLAKPYLWATNTEDRSRNLGYYFTDVTGKVNYKINKRNRIYLSSYFGKDKFYSSQQNTYKDSLNHIDSSTDMDLGWGNYTTVLRWNSIISDKLFSNAILAYSNYNFNVGLDNEFTDYNLKNDQTQATSIEFLSGVREFVQVGTWIIPRIPIIELDLGWKGY